MMLMDCWAMDFGPAVGQVHAGTPGMFRRI